MYIKIFILFIYFINIYNIDAKFYIHTKKNKNNISINIKNKILKKNFFKKNKQINLFFKSKKIDKIVKEAKSYLGTPYKYGGNSKIGIDCSSFILNIFQRYNIALPRISYKQAKKGLIISKNELQKGDLLFFSTRFMEKTRIDHVGIILDLKKNNISFIHASSSNGVIISRIKDSYWKSRFMTARRIT